MGFFLSAGTKYPSHWWTLTVLKTCLCCHLIFILKQMLYKVWKDEWISFKMCRLNFTELTTLSCHRPSSPTAEASISVLFLSDA